MPRERTIKVGALNIAMHSPHSPRRYVQMMNDVFKLQRMVRLRKVYGAMLGTLYAARQGSPDLGLNGEIYRFLKLDPNEPWFNSATREVATEGELRSIKIPEHLLPHLQRIPFVFRPMTHRLYFAAKDRTDSLGPLVAQRLFDQLLAPLINEMDYPSIEVTVMPDQDSIERILRMPALETLTIKLVRPNADDGDDDQSRWLAKLETERARRIELRLVAERNATLQPDEETQIMAKVAATNGSVFATGRDVQGLPIQESTTAKPLLVPATVDSAFETTSGVIDRIADNLDAR